MSRNINIRVIKKHTANERLQAIFAIRWRSVKKNRPHIQEHLVNADTQSLNKKPKELEFLPTLGQNKRNLKTE